MFSDMCDRISRRGRHAVRGALLALGMSVALSQGALAAAGTAEGEIIQAGWKTTEVRYSYVGFTTAFTCDGAEDRVKAILRAVGAHPETKVRAQGCEFNRPTRNFFITIDAAMPVPAAQAAQAADDGQEGRRELLKRLGVEEKRLQERFPAQWHTLRLDRDRKLDLKPGECELLEGLRTEVFPKLGVEVLSDSLRCMPKQVPIVLPELSVKALLPAPSADDPQS